MIKLFVLMGRTVRCALALMATLPLFPWAAHAQEASCASVEPQVLQMLQAMTEGAVSVNFSGVVTLQRGGDMQIVEISHAVEGDRASEQLSRLTGQDAHVARAGHPLQCLHPGHELLLSGLAENDGICGLGAHYRFSIIQGERIAGREAVRLRADPRDMFRFGYTFDLDRKSALMLRSRTLSADQRVIEQYQFASLRMGPSIAASTAAVEYEAQHPHPDEAEHLRYGSPWQVAWVPAGFVPTDSAPPESQRKTYTDGLASFSVFLEPLARPLKAGEGVERQGSTVAYTRGMRLQQQPVLVTVLGEIPTNTARMVADSVKLR